MGNYISASEVKQYSNTTYQDLGFTSDTDYDTFLDTLINQVEDVINNYCRVPSGFFKAGGLSFTELHDWKEDGEIHTRCYPILTLTKVELDYAGYNQTADWTEIPSTYYYAKTEYGIIKIVGKSPSHIENSVRITYTAGYSAVPDDVKLAALIYASNILHVILQRKVAPVVQTGDFTIRLVMDESFSDEVKALLKPYRRKLTRVA
ncbi:hypothetical protein CW705_09935 [Candidatus Bathyarchaeota archaeon]|nr:MAG: hypothetical protein CW705_09935 [Candidatus Bathyarchaeota archaeon]